MRTPSHALRILIGKIDATCRRHRLFAKNDKVVMAVSGGPDSVAMFHALLVLQRKYGLRLSVAHLDHRLNRSQSRKHLRFVRELCVEHKVRFYSKAVDVSRIAKRQGRSVEEMGRLARYDFFERVAAQCRASKIATAHTQDDQAETLLMRLVRGCGIDGLTGIPYQRRQGRYQVVRPLLDVSKQEVLSFLKENRIAFCVDASNRSGAFTRNRVRHELLPLLQRSFNPAVRRSLAHLRTVLAEASEYLSAEAAKAWTRCRVGTAYGTRTILKAEPFLALPLVLQREVLRQALSRAQRGRPQQVDFVHIESILDLLKEQKRGSQLHLPGGLRVKYLRGRVELGFS